MLNPELKIGDRIVCFAMEDEVSVPPGTKGTVTKVQRDPFEEDEKIISSEEFNQFVERCKVSQSKYISKERLIYPDGELKWEVDVFNNGHHLIVAEVEVPSMDFEVKIPKFISDKLLMEVTGMKQFGNRNLSNKYVNKNQTT
jgi:CYTH domain-containing protein